MKKYIIPVIAALSALGLTVFLIKNNKKKMIASETEG